MLRVKLRKLIPRFNKHAFLKEKNSEESEDMNVPVARAKPEALDVLCRSTKFTKKELQIMYRGFKQECPTGIVDEETFKSIYAQFFPQGDSSVYAHFVFNTFDQDRKGVISFEDFVTGLSLLVRGSLQDKLCWAFSLYDLDGDGQITRDEMLTVVSAIYGMMGSPAVPSVDENTATTHVDRLFQKMDINNDGVITADEFMEACRQDEVIFKSFAMFDTVL